MRGIGRIGIVVAVAAVAFVGWNAVTSHRAAAALQKAADDSVTQTVTVITPEPLDGSGEVVLPGTLQANTDAPIYARTNGYLKRWLVDIGTHVKAGQLLAEIDTPEVDQQLSQAQADLATAQANEQIAVVTADRWKALRKTDSVSQQDADEKIALASAARAQEQSARANVARLRQLVDFKRIVAPFDGTITARRTDIGQLINAGSGSSAGAELFRISDDRQLRLYVRVPQADAVAMNSKLVTEVEVPDRPGERFAARLDSTSRAIDASTNTLLVQLLVDNTKGLLLPGSYAQVHFHLPASASSYKVPANTLLFRSEGTQIATVDGSDHVAMKPVVVGRDYGQTIEVVSGLSAGDRVVLSPPDSIMDRQPVRVLTSKPAPAAKGN